MRGKFLLYLTERYVTLYQDSDEKIGPLSGAFESSHREIHKLLENFPKVPISLVIDRGHQDIQEEKLPPLFPWDKFRFLSHKKAQWTREGGHVGFHFLKQGKESFFRWIHLTPNDPLKSWIAWVESLPNPLPGIFFVPLEAGKFIDQTFPSQKKFQMLLYPTSFGEERHVIFKSDRLLLSRPLQGEDDLRTSLHYLSRTFPDIHEELHSVSLLPKTPKFLRPATTAGDFQNFIQFLTAIKKPSIVVHQHSSLRIFWLRIGGMILLVCTLLMVLINVYQGLEHRNKTSLYLSKIHTLKTRSHPNQNIDRAGLQKALEHYHYLKSVQINPLETLEHLSQLINEHNLYLENISWIYEKNPEIILSFLMEIQSAPELSNQLDLFMSACQKLFPNSQIFMVEAPFSSGIQQVFTRPSNQSLPMAQVRIV
jgi:hypothetical protein